MKKQEIVKICESFGDRARGIVKYINYRHKEIDNLKSQLSETEERLKRICKAVVEESELSGDGITLEIYNDVYDWLEDKE